MKKVFIGLAGILLLAIIAVLFVNAKNSPQEVKKSATEVSASCGTCPASCAGMEKK